MKSVFYKPKNFVKRLGAMAPVPPWIRQWCAHCFVPSVRSSTFLSLFCVLMEFSY